MGDNLNGRECREEIRSTRKKREQLPEIVDNLVRLCTGEKCFDHVGPEPLPFPEAVIDILQRANRLLYPGYFLRARLDAVNLKYYLGQEATDLFDLVAEQATSAIRHDCIRHDTACQHCEERGHEIALEFMSALPRLRAMLATDVRAAYEGDPAAKGYDEIIFSYPGLSAITIFRIAHRLFELGTPLIPRIMTEYAHSRTGIDIHPGARIDESFFIDHGTGVVVGETTSIGKRVRIYQGVTLGALSLSKDAVEQLRSEKRHPTIEDDVIIYSGATILGGETVIGARSVIGGNVWITESVPPDTRVFLKKPELVYKGP